MLRILGDTAGEDISAAQAPFTNGVVERYGETLKETMQNIKSDLPQQSFETFLYNAVLQGTQFSPDFKLCIMQDRC